jgi:hypothetical protein
VHATERETERKKREKREEREVRHRLAVIFTKGQLLLLLRGQMMMIVGNGTLSHEKGA